MILAFFCIIRLFFNRSYLANLNALTKFVADASDTDPFLPVPTHSRLGEVLHLFYSQGIHRYTASPPPNHLIIIYLVKLSSILCGRRRQDSRWWTRRTIWWAS